MCVNVVVIFSCSFGLEKMRRKAKNNTFDSTKIRSFCYFNKPGLDYIVCNISLFYPSDKIPSLDM